jgi:hypothetical protein
MILNCFEPLLDPTNTIREVGGDHCRVRTRGLRYDSKSASNVVHHKIRE